MRTIRFLLQKEFRQIFRDPSILRIIFVMPIVQLLILPWAADFEVKDIRLAVVDHDRSDYSRQLVTGITASGYFQFQDYSGSFKEALHLIEKDKADIILEIPQNFEKDLVKENESTLFIAINAINGVKANLGGAYLRENIANYNRDIRTDWIQYPRFSPETNISITWSNWFNPFMNYKHFMVPGILVLLITIVGSFLASMNIVKEKEKGTIEQINVTPIKKYQFIIGKLVPFWILGLFVFTLGILISTFVYGIDSAGSLLTLYVFAAVYMMAILGLGLLISTYSSTQQQAVLVSFFLQMVFVLLGGLYTSIDSMPAWAKVITRLNPVAYFVDVMRLVVLKGSTLGDIKNHLFSILGFAVVLNVWAIANYRKRS